MKSQLSQQRSKANGQKGGYLATIGGTFDSLHAGHKEYIDLAFSYAECVRIYVTTDDYARSRKYYEVKPYASRVGRLKEYLRESGIHADRYEIRPLNSLAELKSDLMNEDVYLAIVVPEYYALLRHINKRRLSTGKNRILILVKERTRDHKNNDLSSTMINQGLE